VAQALTPVDRERLRAPGANIRERRTAGDWTLEDLAHEAGLSATYLGQTERGQRNPSVLVLWRVAEALGITLDQLVAPGSARRPG
jgi:transcriptional regulator with XRE-family HTH domain